MQPRSLLIADGSLPVRTVLMDNLVKLGQPPDTITLAATADEAMDAFKRLQPDPIFIETRMQGKDTLGLIEDMLTANPRVKIVLVTADERNSNDVREAIRMGVFDYVEKPVRMEKIRAVMMALSQEEGGVERMR